MLPFPKFSLAKYLSLHPVTKLSGSPGTQTASCVDTNNLVRSELYIRWNCMCQVPDSPWQLPLHLCCLPGTRHPCFRTTHHLSRINTAVHTLCHPSTAEWLLCAYTAVTWGQACFPIGWAAMGTVSCHFPPCCRQHSRHYGMTTHLCPTLSNRQHHKLHILCPVNCHPQNNRLESSQRSSTAREAATERAPPFNSMFPSECVTT